jgi:hypothetical protein
MPATLQAARKGSHLVNAVRAEYVMIGIDRDRSGRPDGLFVRTLTHEEPPIYWTPAGEHAKPSLAREVLWGADELHKGERIRIEPKPSQHEFFEWNEFEFDERHFAVGTGPVDVKSVNGRKHEWSYNVVLHSPKLSKPLTLDPVIIIVRDP